MENLQSEDMAQLSSSRLLNRIVPQEDAEELYRIYPDLPRNHLTGCPSCGKNNGYGLDGVLELDGTMVKCNCHDQLHRHKHYLNAGIGATYQFVTWKDFVGDQNALGSVVSWVNSLESNVEAGRGLYIWSSVNGTGKTMLGALALKECVMFGYRCYMTTFQNMLSSLKSGWHDAEFDRWYRGKVDSAQVLMIDDVGKELMQTGGFNNEFARQTLDSLLRTRVQQARPTIFTSNLSPGQLQPQYGQAVMSLLTENTYEVAVDGTDFRPSYTSRLKGHRRVY